MPFYNIHIMKEGKKAMRLGLKSYENFLSETEIKREKNDFKREIIIGIIGAIVGSIISFCYHGCYKADDKAHDE